MMLFQGILFLFILVFFIASIGEKEKDRAQNYAAILIASVITQAFLFWMG